MGPGGESYSHGQLGFHYYDADHAGRTTLAIAPVVWGSNGWPTVTW